MNKTLIFIGLIAISYIFYNNSTNDKSFEMNDNNKNNDIQNLNDLKKYIQIVIYNYGFQVTVPMVLAVINTETGLNNFDNNIIGDANKQHKSFGIMQVSLPALSDSTNAYNLNISESDIKTNIKDNILIGICYLNICYKTAQKEVNPNDVVWFTFKKYNGGRNIGFNTHNSSDVYADKTYNKFLELNN